MRNLIAWILLNFCQSLVVEICRDVLMKDARVRVWGECNCGRFDIMDHDLTTYAALCAQDGIAITRFPPHQIACGKCKRQQTLCVFIDTEEITHGR